MTATSVRKLAGAADRAELSELHGWGRSGVGMHAAKARFVRSILQAGVGGVAVPRPNARPPPPLPQPIDVMYNHCMQQESSGPDDGLEGVVDGVLRASRALVAVAARSIASVDDTVTLPQFRTLVALAARGPQNVGVARRRARRARIDGHSHVRPTRPQRLDEPSVIAREPPRSDRGALAPGSHVPRSGHQSAPASHHGDRGQGARDAATSDDGRSPGVQ